MANVIGKLPEEPRRGLLGSLAATVNPVARQRAEMEEGQGIRRLVGLLEQLPDNVTVIIRPKLGWMMDADLCVIGPGRVLVISAVHWKGRIQTGENEEWRGVPGTDLGRPDRRAAYFAKRVEYGGRAAGLTVEPVVVFTDGPVSFGGPEPLATLVYWNEALSVLAEVFPAEAPAPEAGELVRLLGGK
ncbi:MAG TPA: nuclease-related domain-containing protein [Symbiobacteriaceae bacterium]|nr:nuclease-related domain-containing protein [Symbiobacteriaceae bacterium]